MPDGYMQRCLGWYKRRTRKVYVMTPHRHLNAKPLCHRLVAVRGMTKQAPTRVSVLRVGPWLPVSGMKICVTTRKRAVQRQRGMVTDAIRPHDDVVHASDSG